MKKLYISIFALSLTIVAFAQIDSQGLTVEDGKKAKQNLELNSNKLTAPAPLPIWSEDFANGIPTTWQNSNVPWVYRGASTSPSNSVGGQGAYSGINNSPATNNPISSPTSNNGFLIFDSDYYDNNGVVGAFGTGIYSTPHNGELLTDMIDLSSYSDVTLSMNSYFRTFAGQAFIDFYVSGVFQERIQLHTNLAVNESSFIDEVILARVPFSVVGNADVQMSFVFEGTTNVNSGFSGYYFWQIDDLELIETPVNLIEIEDVVVGGFWIDYANYSGAGLNNMIGLDYTVTPLSQLANHPYVIEGVLRNSGSADQLSTLKYEVYGAGSYSGTSAPATVSAYSATNTIDSMIVAANPSLSPGIGTYGVSIWSESDSLGTITSVSDTVYKEIEISEYIYAKDYGENIGTNGSHSGTYILGGFEDQNHITTRYEMYADEQLTSLRVYISDRSHVGAEVKAILYELDSTATQPIFLEESDDYTLTAQDLGNWIDIPFVNPINLFNGWAYEFGVSGFQHPTDSAYVGTSGMSLYNGEHSLFDELGLSTQSAGTPTWYYITATPMVRMNFEPTPIIAISEFGVSMFEVYPNPSLGSFTISLEVSGEFAVSVINVLGQTVYATVIDSKLTKVNLTGISKGMYTVELSSGDVLYTEKLIIE
jgi:hypothetical protein